MRTGAEGRRWPALVAGSFAVAVALAACGEPEPTAEDRQVLRVVMADDWADTGPVVQAVRDFETDHPGVRVDLRGLPFAQIGDSVRVAVDTDEPLDVAQWHPFAAAAHGTAQRIDDLWEQHLDREAFLPGAIGDVEWRGGLYGVPLDTNALILLVNEAALAGSGVTHEQLGSYEGFRAAAERLTVDGRRAIAWPSSSWVAYGMIRANGGEVVHIEDDGEVTFTIDAPEVAEALDMMGSLVQEGLAFGPNQRDDSGDAFTLFQSERTALLTSGTWDLVGLDADLGWDVEAIQVPSGPSASTPGTVLGGSGLFIPAGSEQRELAFAFILELTDDQTALALAESEGRLPARRRVFEADFFDRPEMAPVLQALDHAYPMRLIAFPDAQAAFSVALDEVLLGRRTAAEALADAQRIAEEAHGSPT